MEKFLRNYQQDGQRVKLILNIVILGIALFSFSRRPSYYGKTSSFEVFMIDSITPLQQSVTTVNDKISSFFEHYVKNVSASKNNKDLTRKISDLENQLFLTEEIRKENIRLKNHLEFGVEQNTRKILAQIVAWDSSSDYRVLRINKGESSGVRLQSTVVTSEGLVGYVFRLTSHYSDVLTVLDANNKIDGVVERIRAHGLLEGDSQSKMKMKYVTRTEPIILNDLVITAGLGNIYPKGIRVGRVTRIERESYGITQLIELKPEVNFGTLEEVIVLADPVNKAKEKEWDALDNSEGDVK
jgi:rod shape-determining protein MreC